MGVALVFIYPCGKAQNTAKKTRERVEAVKRWFVHDSKVFNLAEPRGAESELPRPPVSPRSTRMERTYIARGR